jgi:hypothetical protein
MSSLPTISTRSGTLTIGWPTWPGVRPWFERGVDGRERHWGGVRVAPPAPALVVTSQVTGAGCTTPAWRTPARSRSV